jgi:hypothetical protein
MPADDGLGLNDDQVRAPIAPEAREPDPEDAVDRAQGEALFRRTLEYYDLVAQGQDLCLEGKARSKAEKEGRNQRREHVSHGLRSYQAGLVSAMFSAWTELLAGTAE